MNFVIIQTWPIKPGLLSKPKHFHLIFTKLDKNVYCLNTSTKFFFLFSPNEFEQI